MSPQINLSEALDAIWTSRRPVLEESGEVYGKLSRRDLNLLDHICERFLEGTDPVRRAGRDAQPKLLAALQVARDHSDAMAFLPAAERNERMARYSEAFGMNVASFRTLCASWPEIERVMVGWDG